MTAAKLESQAKDSSIVMTLTKQRGVRGLKNRYYS